MSDHLDRLVLEAELARRYSLDLAAGLTAAEITWRPNERSSAIGWHLGHQAAVTHYMVRNLVSAEPSLDSELDRLFDSATEEPQRGALPPLPEILEYRTRSAARLETVIRRIAHGEADAEAQLGVIADGLLRAVINHEYQHAAWIAEVRATLTDGPAAVPTSRHLTRLDGYWLLAPATG